MPRAVRKSLSRCSSRSSSRSSCRRRLSPRDNVLSSIREAVRSSPAAGRRSTFERESPLLRRPAVASSICPEVRQETKISGDFKPEADMPKAAKLPGEDDVAEEKPRGLVQHGIRYIMLPLHLFHLCVWGSPASSDTKEIQSSSPKLQENRKKSSNSSSAKNLPRRTLAPSPTSSTSGFSSCSSNFSKTSRVVPIVDLPMTSSASLDVPKVATSSASSSSSSSSSTSGRLPVEDLSPKTRPAPVPRRIFQEIPNDESSDEMVTADECFDDSSNDRWSTAESSPSMNMSIDFEGWGDGFERTSSNPTDEDCSVEEPMEVSMEESSSNFNKSIGIRSPYRDFRSGSLRSKVECRSDRISSSSGSDQPGSSCREDTSVSSADREIAGIFQRASTSPSSSSEDDDRFRFDGRRNNPFANRTAVVELPRSRPREELCDATIRKRRTALEYSDPPREFHGRRTDRGTPEGPSNSSDRPSNSSGRPSNSSGLSSNYSDRPSNSSGLSSNSSGRSSNSSDRPSNSSGRPSNSSGRPSNSSDRPSNSSDRPSNSSDRPSNSSGRPSNSSGRSSNSSDRPSNSSGRPSNSSDRPSNSSRTRESSEEKSAKRINVDPARIADQTDSAYSDEDVEMNSINESINHRLQSFTMQSLQESVIEWMDQDLDYVADTEDSNDGSPLTGSSKFSSAAPNPRSRFVELDGLPVEKNSASPEVEKTFGRERSSLATRTASPEVAKKIDEPKKTPRPMTSPEVERRSDQWRKNFGLGGSEPKGSPETPQQPNAPKCHCGNPKCFFIPVALPIDASSSTSWAIKDYPRPPSPLGQGNSLYYKYPPFIIPPAETMGDKKSPYVLVPANFILH